MRVVAVAALALVFTGAANAQLTHLTKADRAEINRTMDILVNSAVKRVDLGRSYDIVTPEMKAGMTRKQWEGGAIPVYPFPAKGHKFHYWSVKWISDNTVGIEILLMPTLRNKFDVGPIIFDVYLVPHGKRFLVDGFMPMATLAPVNAKHAKVRSVADFSPQPAQQGAAPMRGKLNPNYLFFPFVAMATALLLFGSWWFVKSRRERRLMGPRHSSMPPMPARIPRQP
jgi:hypothetical protein